MPVIPELEEVETGRSMGLAGQAAQPNWQMKPCLKKQGVQYVINNVHICTPVEREVGGEGKQKEGTTKTTV